MDVLTSLSQWVGRLLNNGTQGNELLLGEQALQKNRNGVQQRNLPPGDQGSRRGAPLSLQIGEILQGQVMEVISPHEALVQIKGTSIHAQMDTPLLQGKQPLRLVVTGHTESGMPMLQIIDTLQGKNGTAFLEKGAERLLSQYQMENTPLARQVVLEMMQTGVPVTRQGIQQIVKLLQDTGSTQQTSVTTAVRMLALQIPLSKWTFQGMDTLWNGPPFHMLLADLKKLQATLPGKESAFSDPQVPAEEILSLDQWPQLSNKEQADMLRQMKDQLGLTHEAELLRRLLEKPGQDNKEKVSPTWKTVALEMESAVTQGAKDSVKPSVGKEVADAAETLLANLTGQQLSHTQKNDVSPFFYHFFALPIAIADRQSTAEIHLVTHRDSNRKLDPANCLLFLHLDLPRLGSLDVFVHSIEKVVTLRFLVPQSSHFDVTEKEISQLRTGLEGIGYHLGSLRIEKQEFPLSKVDRSLFIRRFLTTQVDVRI